MKMSLRALFAVLLVATAARADTIYTNFGPGETYDCCSGWNIQDDFDGFQGVAVPFTPSADFADSTFTVPIYMFHGGEFGIGLFSNSNGLPGIELDITMFDASNEFGQGVFSGSMGPLSAGTTYWLVVLPVGEDNLITSAWNENSTGDTGPWAWTPDGTTWYMTNNFRPAYEIEGTPVPEPATIVLLGTGLLGLAAKHKLAKR